MTSALHNAKRLGWAGLLTCLTAVAAHAQDFNAQIREAWTEYQTECGALISDPGTYLAQHPNNGLASGFFTASSPDGQVVQTSKYRPQGGFYGGIVGIPGKLVLLCTESSFYGTDWTGTYDPSNPPVYDMITPAQMNANAQGLSQALLGMMSGMADTTVVGGKIPFAYNAGDALRVPGIEEPDTYMFGIETKLAGKDVFAWAYVYPMGIEIISQYIITAEGQ